MRKRATNPKFVKKIPGVDPTKRADFGKSHIIISERRDKKAAKFMVKDLPFPYTSARQYERSLEVPLGAEWNTRVGFQKGTLPRVVKKVSGGVFAGLLQLFTLNPIVGYRYQPIGKAFLILGFYIFSHLEIFTNEILLRIARIGVIQVYYSTKFSTNHRLDP